MKSIVFIINPVSGVHHERKEKLRNLIPDYFPSDEYKVNVVFSQKSGEGYETASRFVAEGTDTLVAVGGDGTVNEIARAVVNTQSRLGIVPLGSGNGLAHFLKIPFRIEEALEVIRSGEVIKMDTLRINDILAVSIAGMGFDARVARQYALDQRRGFLTYARIAFVEYFAYRSRKFRIESPHFSFSVKALLVSIANSDQFGYNTTIAPQASVTDGMADIAIVRKIPWHTLLLTGLLLFTRRIDRSRYVSIYRAPELIITRKKGKYVNIDGEPVKMPRQIHVKVHPASLNILIPSRFTTHV